MKNKTPKRLCLGVFDIKDGDSNGKNKINRRLEKGITLVALVVTIIVLLILAGVTIGNNAFYGVD